MSWGAGGRGGSDYFHFLSCLEGPGTGRPAAPGSQMSSHLPQEAVPLAGKLLLISQSRTEAPDRFLGEKRPEASGPHGNWLTGLENERPRDSDIGNNFEIDLRLN